MTLVVPKTTANMYLNLFRKSFLVLSILTSSKQKKILDLKHINRVQLSTNKNPQKLLIKTKENLKTINNGQQEIKWINRNLNQFLLDFWMKSLQYPIKSSIPIISMETSLLNKTSETAMLQEEMHDEMHKTKAINLRKDLVEGDIKIRREVDLK